MPPVATALLHTCSMICCLPRARGPAARAAVIVVEVSAFLFLGLADEGVAVASSSVEDGSAYAGAGDESAVVEHGQVLADGAGG